MSSHLILEQGILRIIILLWVKWKFSWPWWIRLIYSFRFGINVWVYSLLADTATWSFHPRSMECLLSCLACFYFRIVYALSQLFCVPHSSTINYFFTSRSICLNTARRFRYPNPLIVFLILHFYPLHYLIKISYSASSGFYYLHHVLHRPVFHPRSSKSSTSSQFYNTGLWN